MGDEPSQHRGARNKLTELAGLYAVASELALHGWHASPTVGNFPAIDLHAFHLDSGKRVTIQVKARGADQKPSSSVRQEQGKIGKKCGGWGVGTWKFKSQQDPELPGFRHPFRDGWWCLSGFAAESDAHVFVWFEKGELDGAEFYVMSTAELRRALSSPDDYLRKYTNAAGQPCWIGKGLLAACKGGWDTLLAI